MNKIIKAIVIGLALIDSGSIWAVTSEISIASQNDHKVYLIDEKHIDAQGSLKGPQQKREIIAYVQSLNEVAQSDQDKPYIITEDNLHYDGKHTYAKEFIDEMSAYARKIRVDKESNGSEIDANEIEITNCSLLENIVNDSINAGIDCYNAECRQLKYASEDDGCVTGKEVVLKTEKVRSQIMKDLEEISQDAQTDSNAQIVYDECMSLLDKAPNGTKELVDILRDSNESIKELLEKNELPNMYDAIALYDTYLIDARILIAWYKNRDRKNCFIVAGGAHTERILPIIERMGYEVQVHGKKYPMTQEGNIQMVQNSLNINQFFKDLTDAQQHIVA